MHRHHDTLTYRYPRTEIEAFGCDNTSAYAITRYKKRQIMPAKWLLRVGVVGWFTLFFWGLSNV